MKINQHLSQFRSARIGKFVELFDGSLTREQVKTIIYNLVEYKFPEYSGKGSGRQYFLGKAAIDEAKFFDLKTSNSATRTSHKDFSI